MILLVLGIAFLLTFGRSGRLLQLFILRGLCLFCAAFALPIVWCLLFYLKGTLL